MKGNENKRWSSALSARCEYSPFLSVEIPCVSLPPPPFEPKEGEIPGGKRVMDAVIEDPRQVGAGEAVQRAVEGDESCWRLSTNQMPEKNQEIEVIARLIILAKCSPMEENTFRERERDLKIEFETIGAVGSQNQNLSDELTGSLLV